jgi:transcriptional regulator with XRE-family HTH domain
LDPIDLEIGARLRALRESRSMTQAVLALAGGVTSADVDQYETGLISAPVSVIVRMARVLNASAAELISGWRANWNDAVGELAKAGAEGTSELTSAFLEISDDRVRRAFLDLAWTIVSAQTGAKHECGHD